MRPWPFITFSLQYRYFLTRIEHHRCTMISQRLAVLAALIAILMAIVYWININVGDGVQRVGHSMALITDYARQTSTVAYTGEMQGLTVIGAGFPRTGTKSIEKALQSLGHRVYDMRAAMELKHMDRWVQAATDWKEHDDLGGVKALVQEMEAAGFTATLDLPMNLFALAFAELRPKAKVLFSVRDTKEKWMESLTTLSRTFGPFIYCRPYSWIFPKLQAASNILLTLEGLETTRPTYPTHLDRPFPWFEKIHTHPIEAPEKRKAWMELHQRFQKRLQQKLSKDRLLVFNVKQGWAPLIPFLGIQDKDAVTRQDFPNIHDGNTLKVIRRVMDLCAFAAPVIFLIFLWIMTRVLHTCVRCKLALDERRMKAKRQ